MSKIEGYLYWSYESYDSQNWNVFKVVRKAFRHYTLSYHSKEGVLSVQFWNGLLWDKRNRKRVIKVLRNSLTKDYLTDKVFTHMLEGKIRTDYWRTFFEKEKCVWWRHDRGDRYYHTDCGTSFEWLDPPDDLRGEGRFKYCPFCGEKIEEVTEEEK